MLQSRKILSLLIPCWGCCCLLYGADSVQHLDLAVHIGERKSDTDTTAGSLKDTIQLKEVTISTGVAMRTSIAKAVLPVKIINAMQIEQSGAQNLKEVLINLLNINIQQDGILGAGMSMMGLSGENVKILMDGMPVIGRQNGNIDLSQIAMHNVERIEIVQGPLSTNYGTNALAGVINIITKKMPSEPIDIQLKTYNEINRHYNISGNIGIKKEQQSINISGGRNFFQGWSPTPSGRTFAWKPKIFYFGDLNYRLDYNGLQLGYTASYADEYMLNRGTPLLPYKEEAFDDVYRTVRYGNNLVAQYRAPKHYWSVQAGYNHYERRKNTYLKDLTTLEQLLTRNEGDQDTSKFDLTNVRANWVTTQLRHWTIEAGMDLNLENGLGRRLKNQSQHIGDYALFGSVEYEHGGLKIRPSLRCAYNTSYASPLLPAIAAKYSFGENQKYALRATWAKGFRAPSLKELYFYFVDVNHNIRGNENLKAETSNSYQLSFFCQIFNAHIPTIIESSLFCNVIQNQITLAAIDATEYGYVNIGALTTFGNNVSAKIHWKAKNLEVQPGFAWTQRIQHFEGSNYIANAKEARLGINYQIPATNCTVNLLYKYVGKQPGYVREENGKVSPIFVGAYQMSDMTLNGKSWHKQWRWTLGIKNIFNVQNIQSRLTGEAHSSAAGTSQVGTGRSFFIASVFELGNALKKIRK